MVLVNAGLEPELSPAPALSASSVPDDGEPVLLLSSCQP